MPTGWNFDAAAERAFLVIGVDTNFTMASGNSAEFVALSETSISVLNGTCAGGTPSEPMYWILVTMTVPVLPLANDAGIMETADGELSDESNRIVFRFDAGMVCDGSGKGRAE